jgi:dipeptidyl aminopeptidase/acylaminoacyl peptidase
VDTQPVTSDDLYLFRWPDHVRLSPAGDRIAYQVSWADAESRQNKGYIYLRAITPGATPFQATSGPRRDHYPEWSPDGKRLAFLSRRGPRDQVYILDVAGGDARQLTSIQDGASTPSWSPDGKQIAFLGTVLADPDGVVDDPRPPTSDDEVRRAPVARVAQRLDYKHDGSGYVDGRHQHLLVVPADGGEARQLTSGAWSVGGFGWSPDGRRLAVVGNPEPDADLRREVNLYSVDLEGKLKLLVADRLISSPRWSPKGDLVAYLAPNGKEAGLNERLWVVPADGGEPRCLTLGLDQAVGDGIISDMRSGHGGRVKWSGAGDSIYFLSSGAGQTGVYSVSLDGEAKPEISGRRRVMDFDNRPEGFVFISSDPTTPGDLYIAGAGGESRLTELNPWLRERRVAIPERLEFAAPDGLKIEGWLLKPDGFDASRKHPLVMEVHGGPHGQYGWAFFHEFQILAGKGLLVFYVNPRGSDGYGEQFKKAVVRDWGGKDYVDLMTALDQLIARGFVDEKRMGIAGGSYGGFMTNWVIGQTDRFAAAVTMRCISNLVSEFAQHDIVIWGELEMGPRPWPDSEELWKRSPIRYVNNIETPLLISHGEMDLRCAISQAEEMFGALRLLGKTVEMVRYPGESHDLSRGGRPDRRVERLNRIGGWFERHLLTSAEAEAAPGAEAEQATEAATPR